MKPPLVSEMIAPLRSEMMSPPPGDRAVLATSVVISFVPVVKPLNEDQRAIGTPFVG